MDPIRVDTGSVPPLVRTVWELLGSAGPTYLVGGAARDVIRGRAPRDWDLATILAPDDTVALVRRVHPEWMLAYGGIRWGTVAIHGPKGSGAVDVTSFRADGVYRDGRRPSSVRFGTSWAEDAARRDFTMNALAIDLDGQVVDTVGGLRDLAAGCVRSVGPPVDRFREDPLRMWRAVRLLSQGGFHLEEATARAIRVERPRLAMVAPERQGEELTRLLAAQDPEALGRALAVLQELGVWDVIWPEWAVARGFPQNGHPVDAHCLATAVALPPRLRLAGLLHDIGKPVCARQANAGAWRFDGHEQVSALWADRMLRRMRFPGKTTEDMTWLVAHHGFRWRQATATELRRLWVDDGPDRVRSLLTLYEADVAALDGEPPSHPSALGAKLEAAVVTDAPYGLALACTGEDVQEWLGIARPSRAVGSVLTHLRHWVLLHPENNRREALHREALQWQRRHGEVPPDPRIEEGSPDAASDEQGDPVHDR